MTAPTTPERSIAAALDRILENQNRGLSEQVAVKSRLHTIANFLTGFEQRIFDVRDDIKGVMRTVENMHAENKITLMTLQQQVDELSACKALLEAIQLEGKLAQQYKDHLLSREVATTPTPENDNNGERHESERSA